METLTAILTIAVFILEIVTMIVVIRFCNKAGAYIDYKNSAIIVLVSIAIASTIIMGTTILIRQRKILRKLDELTKKTEEPSTEDKP